MPALVLLLLDIVGLLAVWFLAGCFLSSEISSWFWYRFNTAWIWPSVRTSGTTLLMASFHCSALSPFLSVMISIGHRDCSSMCSSKGSPGSGLISSDDKYRKMKRLRAVITDVRGILSGPTMQFPPMPFI